MDFTFKNIKVLLFMAHFVALSSNAAAATELWGPSYCVDKETTEIAMNVTQALAQNMLEDRQRMRDLPIEVYYRESEKMVNQNDALQIAYGRETKESVLSVHYGKGISNNQGCRYIDAYSKFIARGREGILKKHKIDQVDLIISHQYTTGLYERMNGALRSKKTTTSLNYLISRLDITLNKLTPYKGVVRRGVDLPRDVVDQLKVGSVYSDPAFMSTSRDSGFNGQYKLIIKSKTGRQIEDLSATPDEYEVLFKRGTRFKVTKIYSKPEGMMDQKYIEMEEI